MRLNKRILQAYVCNSFPCYPTVFISKIMYNVAVSLCWWLMVIKKEQKEEVQTAASMFNVSSCVVYNNSWHFLCVYSISNSWYLCWGQDQHDQSMSNIHVYATAFDQLHCCVLTVASQIIDLYIRDQTLVIHELTNFQQSKWIVYW